MSTFERGASPTLSMREKSLLKRRVNKEHNSNFRAGYVNVNEEQLHKTGIRGRKRYVVCCVTFLLAITVIANILLTVTVLAVLGVDRHGMGALEFIPRGRLLRFLGRVDVDEVHVVEPVLGSLPDGALELSGEEGGKVEIQVIPKTSSSVTKISVGQGGTTFQSDEGLDVLDPDTGRVVFSTDPDKMNLPDRLESIAILQTSQVVTDRVTSDTGDPLQMSSDKRAELYGAEGVQFMGQESLFTAKLNLSLSTMDALSIDAKEGTKMKFYDGLPVKDDSAPVREDILTYKLCVHSPDGSLYAVPWNLSCTSPSGES